jgi:hypothetical protein
MSNLAKFPSDVLDYGFDWTAFLGSDTILTATMSASPAGLTVGTTSHLGYIVKAMISGGATGNTYLISCVITTSGGLTANSDFKLDIREAR